MLQLALVWVAGDMSDGVCREASGDCGNEAAIVYLARGMAESCPVAKWGEGGSGVNVQVQKA